jgi:DNA repair protein RadC
MIKIKLKTMLPKIKVKVTYSKYVPKDQRTTIKTSVEAANVAKELFNKNTISWVEEMYAVYLSRANDVIGTYLISKGGTAGTVCDPKVVFTTALNCNAHGVILTHNHPSGNLNPSLADKEITNKVKEAALLLDMKLVDHIIVTEDGYYSFADEGII